MSSMLQPETRRAPDSARSAREPPLLCAASTERRREFRGKIIGQVLWQRTTRLGVGVFRFKAHLRFRGVMEVDKIYKPTGSRFAAQLTEHRYITLIAAATVIELALLVSLRAALAWDIHYTRPRSPISPFICNGDLCKRCDIHWQQV